MTFGNSSVVSLNLPSTLESDKLRVVDKVFIAEQFTCIKARNFIVEILLLPS